MTYSPHAHVQRTRGGKRRMVIWKCSASGCQQTRYTTSAPRCPDHRVLMVRRSQQQGAGP